MEQQLIELHARAAFDDRDDALMILDRRVPGDLELVDEGHEDPLLLSLGDEVGDRTGAERPVLGDVQLPDHAAGPQGLKHRVRSGDRIAGTGLVRRRAHPRTRGHPADLLGVAGAPVAPIAAGSRGSGPTPRRSRPGPCRPPTRAPLLLLCLPAFIRRELGRLRRSLVLTLAKRPRRGRA